MKRAALTIITTVAGLAILLGFKTSPIGAAVAGFAPGNAPGSTVTAGAGTNSGAGAGSGSGSGSNNGSGSSGAGAQPGPSAQGKQTVTGNSAGTPYGPVQVRVTSVNGQISNVEVLQAPWSTGVDQQINGYALPILVQETIKAQSATIDMVSGASYTSHGYVTSLQSALDQLHA